MLYITSTPEKPCLYFYSAQFYVYVFTGLRMKRSRRRQPIRSLPCRRLWRWRKSVQCQQPTYPLLRKFVSAHFPEQQPCSPPLEINVQLSFSVWMCSVVSVWNVCVYILCLIYVLDFSSTPTMRVLLWCCLVYYIPLPPSLVVEVD